MGASFRPPCSPLVPVLYPLKRAESAFADRAASDLLLLILVVDSGSADQLVSSRVFLRPKKSRNPGTPQNLCPKTTKARQLPARLPKYIICVSTVRQNTRSLCGHFAAPQITQLRERNSEINFYFTRVISAKNEVDIGGYEPTGD
jgi:hypothetical protein